MPCEWTAKSFEGVPARAPGTKPSANFGLLSGRFLADSSKRKMNCKARIYKCIKRILKRNTFAKDYHSLQQHQQQQQQPSLADVSQRQVRGKSKVDYREIKSLLEKEQRSLEYDRNLAKCVEKPAMVKNIALNLLKSAEDDGRSLMVHREQPSETDAVACDHGKATEYQRLCGEAWYHENLPRDHSLDMLTDKVPGSFVVRKSTTQHDCYALSLRVPPPGPKIAHYLIVRTANDGYRIKGFQKEFTSLRALIVHHSVMPEALPVPLAVPRPANLVVKTKCDDDYETVFDLTGSSATEAA